MKLLLYPILLILKLILALLQQIFPLPKAPSDVRARLVK